MAFVTTRVYNYTKSFSLYGLSILFYGFTPAWQIAAQQALKDVLHTGWYLLFYLEFLNCIDEKDVPLREIIWLCFCAIILSFTRKAAFYLAVLCIGLLMIVKRKHFKAYLICLSVVVILFMGSNKILFPMLNISGEKERENYSLQFQQVALYCIEYGDEMTEDEKRIINGTLDYDTIVEKYTPLISDPVKATFHGSEEDHAEFWALYSRMIQRHPLFFLKAMIMTSFEHINPWYAKNFTQAVVMISKDDSFHKIRYPNSNSWKMATFWANLSNYPFTRLLCGNGLSAWILIVMLGYAIKTHSGKTLLGLSLHLFLLAGLFMSHVNGEIRYGYPLIAGSPLIIAYTIYVLTRNSRQNTLEAEPPSPQPVHVEMQWLKTFGDKPDKDGFYDI